MEPNIIDTTAEAEVFVVAGVRLFRDGLTLALRQAVGVHVAGAAASVAELGDGLAAAVLPVLLLDVGTATGPEALAPLLETHPRLLVLAMGLSGVPAEIVEWIESGASGYVTCQHSIDDLTTAIRSLVHDELTCPPEVAGALMRRVATLGAQRRQVLTNDLLSPREREVVRLIDQGLSNKQIASQLYITVATVKNHVHNILDKLDVRARGDVAAYVRGLHAPASRTASRSTAGDSSPHGVQ